MNMEALMAQIESQRTEKSSMYNQEEMMNNYQGDLERHKAGANKKFVWYVPFMLAFPFNPLKPEDPSFNAKKRFKVLEGATKFVKDMKAIMRENEELHKFYAARGGFKVEEYDISTDENGNEVVTKQDFKIFNQYKIPAQFSFDTQRLKTKAAGKFGKQFRSHLEKDAEGAIINDTELAAQILFFEQDCVKQKVAKYLLDTVGGDRSQLKQDQKDQLTAYKQSSALSYPSKSGVSIVLEFDVEQREQEEGGDRIEIADPRADLDKRWRSVNVNGEMLNKIMKKHKSKADKNLDFMLLLITYTDGAGSNKSKDLAIAESRQYEFVERYDSEKPDVDEDGFVNGALDPAKVIKNIDDKVAGMIDEGLRDLFEKMIKRNIWKFKYISDNELAGLWAERPDELKDYVTEKMYNNYISLIEMVNPKVAKELTELKKKGLLCKDYSQVIAIEGSQEQQKGLEELDKMNEEEKAKSLEIEDKEEVYEEGAAETGEAEGLGAQVE